MARLNVYVPDELAEQARHHGLNVSALTQAAISAEIDRRAAATWLSALVTPGRPVPHAAVLDAIDDARADFDDVPDARPPGTGSTTGAEGGT